MRKLSFIVLFLLSLHVAAQNELWHGGAVVTIEDKVVTGEILFHPQFDLLVIRDNDITEVLPASRIKSFRFFDEAANINRKFASLAGTDYLFKNKIYEIVLLGEISVLRRAKSTFAVTASDADGYQYYFQHEGKISSLKKFRNILYPRMKELLVNEEKQLRLNPNQMADAIRFIELYNRKFSGFLASR
jgi:hypothetical protein